ncbi:MULTISPECIES: acyl-CoA dehydrogenase family protein [Mycobacterium]|nr:MULTISPECIES: acyl-CoA dehydrogenase family protein [Mycobacterium]MCA2247607.1 acyl-CoA dehydrogenase family protein [Mycobacterium intracellulare]MEA1157943.1 acyl-CoA dehydrogenase family protein [Mycobacterium europaeum]
MTTGSPSVTEQQIFTDDLWAYRQAVRSYVRGEPALQRWRGTHYPTTEDHMAEHAALMAQLFASGWSRYGWPQAAGGFGGDERHRAVLYDELSAAGVDVPEQQMLLEVLGPAVLHFAPDLAAEYLRAYLAGEEWWSQSFSEPDAGSDLAGLRCRARRDGDTYVVSGQKIWTSHGVTARRLIALLRTGTLESRHRGLTMIMIDTDTPGISIRPITLASGQNELSEVFFDDVVVPASRLVGAEGQGWQVAMFLLQFERAMYAWLSATVAARKLRDLRDTLAELPDGGVRRLGQCYADIVTLKARSAQTVRRLAAGEAVGPEASVDKILLATAETALHDLARDLMPCEFLFGDEPAAAHWRDDWWYSRASTIMGGSAEVQRGIIADRVLGLPKETTA